MSEQPADSCRDERLALGYDELVERGDDYVLVRCVRGMHCGYWILWGADGLVRRMGLTDGFVRDGIAPPAISPTEGT